MTARTIAGAALLVAATIGGIGNALAANPEAGKKFASEVCVACHGVEGNSANPDFPKLGGQHPDYLAKALRDYQSGARSNPIMKGFAAMLKAEDIENVAAWYASQPQVLGMKR